MIKFLGHLLKFWALFFFGVVVSSLFGAFTGWCVGLIFGKTILGILATLGIEGFKMWQIGVFLGFVGGFFRTLTSNDAPQQAPKPKKQEMQRP
jgi:hypothetical protein